MRSAVIITTSADGKTSAEHFLRAEDGKQAFRKLSGVNAELWLSDAGRTKRIKAKAGVSLVVPAAAETVTAPAADEATYVLEKGEPVLPAVEAGDADEAAAFLAETPAADAPAEVASEVPAPAPVEVAQEVPAAEVKPKRKGKKAAETGE